MSHDNPNDPEGHELWADFVTYSNTNGIPLEYKEDWKAWWDCFIAGSSAQFRIDMVGK